MNKTITLEQMIISQPTHAALRFKHTHGANVSLTVDWIKDYGGYYDAEIFLRVNLSNECFEQYFSNPERNYVNVVKSSKKELTEKLKELREKLKLKLISYDFYSTECLTARAAQHGCIRNFHESIWEKLRTSEYNIDNRPSLLLDRSFFLFEIWQDRMAQIKGNENE